MDPISSYVLQNRVISLNVLFSIFYRLQVMELQQTFLSFHQIYDVVRLVLDSSSSTTVENESKQEEILFYSGVIYESCVRTKITSEGATFCLKKELKEQTEIRIVQNVIRSLKERDIDGSGIYAPAIQHLEQQCQKFLGTVINPEAAAPPQERFPLQTNSWDGDDSFTSPPGIPAITAPSAAMLSSRVYPIIEGSSMNYSNVHDEDDYFSGFGVEEEYPQHPTEKNEAMVKFLAHIRKSGMDLLFPQIVHDKLLVTLYVATKCAAPLAHRQLMDMILATKQSKVLGNDLDVVSKTKIRGILALLKNAHALLTTGGNGESVRLYLGKGVNSFREFREKHDNFLNRCILQQHTFLPIALKAEIIWPSDEQAIAEKCHLLEKIEPILGDYFVMGRTTSKKQLAPANYSAFHNRGATMNPRPDISGRKMSTPYSSSTVQQFTSLHGNNLNPLISNPYSFRDVPPPPPTSQYRAQSSTNLVRDDRLGNEIDNIYGYNAYGNPGFEASPTVLSPSRNQINTNSQNISITFPGSITEGRESFHSSIQENYTSLPLQSGNNNNINILSVDDKNLTLPSNRTYATMDDNHMSFSSYEK